MLSFIAIFAIFVSAHNIKFSGKLEKEVASPNVYVNLGQLEKTTIVNGKEGRLFEPKHIPMMEPMSIKHFEMSHGSEMEPMKKIAVGPGSTIASPKLEFKIKSIQNDNQ
ncbi:hypothetical protein DSO57_1012900 [Entomophthora muscae]|uniref:Uncharacterized protein n=1 Tax=Entomophthora muscae TaxID=34485 RepID=A0ACC2SJ29_9FUNG|nr:hypothetical protein DSO57_1012900 [Entomophthora muscae]